MSLNVADLTKSATFYEALGFRRCDETGGNVTLQKGDCRLSLYEGDLDPARPQLIFWQGDVDAIGKFVEAQGIPIGRRVQDEKGKGVMLFDPDGHPLYFVNIAGMTRQDPGVESAA